MKTDPRDPITEKYKVYHCVFILINTGNQQAFHFIIFQLYQLI